MRTEILENLGKPKYQRPASLLYGRCPNFKLSLCLDEKMFKMPSVTHDQNMWVMMENSVIHIGRPENSVIHIDPTAKSTVYE
jgi:hypothetical protein